MKKILFLIPVFAILIASCGKKAEHFNIIPANAPVVFVVNTPGIIKKVTLNSISNLSFTENWDLFKDSTAATTKVGKLMKNTGDAGIDIKEEVYGWVNFAGNKNWLTTCFYLEKQDKLAQFVKDSLKSEITTVGQFQAAVLDSTTLLAWNEGAALVMYSDGFVTIDSLKKSLFNLPAKDADNIGNQEGFKKLRSDGHDVSAWIRSELFKNNLPSYLSTLGYIDGFMYADFNNGQIEFAFEETIKDKELQTYTGTLNATSGLKDFSAFNKDRLLAAVAGSVNFTSAYVLKNKDTLNQTLAQYNVTADDVYKSFTGDFAIGVQGVKKTSRTVMSYDYDEDFNPIEVMDTIEETTPLVTAIFKLKDDKAAGIVLDKIAEKLGFLLTGGHYTMTTPAAGGTITHVYIKNGQLVISNDEEVWSGKASAELSKEAKSALQQPLSIYMNYQLLHKADLGEHNPFKGDDTKEIISQMDFMSFALVEEKPNVYKFTLDMSFLNKDENALIQIMKFRRNNKKKNDIKNTDTTATVKVNA